MLFRKRPLGRAATLGGPGDLAYRAGKNAQQQQCHGAEQDAQPTGPRQRAEAAVPPPPHPAEFS